MPTSSDVLHRLAEPQPGRRETFVRCDTAWPPELSPPPPAWMPQWSAHVPDHELPWASSTTRPVLASFWRGLLACDPSSGRHLACRGLALVTTTAILVAVLREPVVACVAGVHRVRSLALPPRGALVSATARP